MTHLTRRQRMLMGAFGLAAAVWAVDALTRGGPAPAQATQPGGAAPPAPQVEWQDLGGLVNQLTHAGYTSVAPELDNLVRDLFVPTPLLEPELPATELVEPDDSATEPPDVAPVPEVPFAQRHRLAGVLVGRSPLAMIDDQLVPLNSDIDGFTLIEVHRDSVVLRERSSGQVVTLALTEGPGNP